MASRRTFPRWLIAGYFGSLIACPPIAYGVALLLTEPPPDGIIQGKDSDRIDAMLPHMVWLIPTLLLAVTIAWWPITLTVIARTTKQQPTRR